MTRARYLAEVQQQDGSTDPHGQPDYDAWVKVHDVPAKRFQSVTGGETIRGRQVTAQTTHMMIADYYSAEFMTTEMRVVVEGQAYGVVSVLDMQGTQKEMRIELRKEQ